MTIFELKREANNLGKMADEIEYLASTLTYKHQLLYKSELELKAKNIREVKKEYEKLVETFNTKIDDNNSNRF